jgi:hypothetical protein
MNNKTIWFRKEAHKNTAFELKEMNYPTLAIGRRLIFAELWVYQLRKYY